MAADSLMVGMLLKVTVSPFVLNPSAQHTRPTAEFSWSRVIVND